MRDAGDMPVCLRFAQPRLEPLHALDWMRLVPRLEPGA